MKDITILITYSQEHQNSYINFMLSTLNHTISNKKRYKILLGVDTGKKKNPDLKKINFPYDKMIQVDTGNSDYSSYAHSLVMDEMIKHIDTKYAMICDSDIALLEKNWDVDFINMLDNKNIFLGGESNHITYYFPHIYMAFFNAEKIKKINISFAPIKNKPDFIKKYNIKIDKDDKKYDVIIPNELEKYYKVKEFYADTSSLLPYYIKKNGFDGISLKCIWSNGKRKRYLEDHKMIFLNTDDQGQEFIINNKSYFTHQGRSSRIWGVHPKNIQWVNQVKKYFKKKYNIELK
jgi:hypothetical protein